MQFLARTKVSLPDYCKVEPTVLSTKTITSDFVHPASALISRSVRIVPLHVRRCIKVHVIIYVAKFRIVFCWAILELPLIRRNVMSRNGHVECAMHEE